MYIAQLDRFDEIIIAIGNTEKEARDAVIKKYIEIFKECNEGKHPSRIPFCGRSYLAGAKDDVFVTDIEIGKAQFL